MSIQYWFFSDIGYTISSVLSKVSISLFLLRVIVHPAQRGILCVVTGLVVLTGIAFFVIFLSQCSPTSYFWTRMRGSPIPQCAGTRRIIIILYIFTAVSALFDLTVGLLPIFLVRGLQMNRKTKSAVATLLGMACV